MKKTIKLFLIIATLFLLCSCKDSKTYELTELTSEELATNLLSKDSKGIVFAAYNSQQENSSQFLKDLKSVATNVKLDIYYIDYDHLDVSSSGLLFSMDGINLQTNSYYALINGELIVAEEYTDFTSMYKNLKSVGYKPNIIKTSDEQKKDYLKEAEKLYEEGQVSKAFDTLNKAWTLQEAKETYNNNPYYKLMISWETYVFKDKEMKDMNYYSLLFIRDANYFLKTNKRGIFGEFTKPNNVNDYDKVYYYIKNDIIYTSTREKGTYKETYKITYIDDDHLNLTDLKDKKEYKFVRRS